MADVLFFGLIAFSCGLCLLYIFTQIQTRKIEKSNPPAGLFYNIDGMRLHAKFTKSKADIAQGTLVFIHGASGNLRDQMEPFAPLLEAEFDLLFIDRPGHGWSERGAKSNEHPDEQAKVIAKLLDHLAIDNAIVIGHSFGCVVTLNFALKFPRKTKALLLLAPVAYPWPGGIAWYYHAAALPVVGWIFTNTLTLPFGLMRLAEASHNVFKPNAMPEDYVAKTAPELVLRPASFRANAKDIASLEAHVTKTWPSYETIKAPTIIISGDQDQVVFPYIHAKGLAWHIKTSQLIELKHMGHKPDYCATEIAVAAIHNLANSDKLSNLTKMAQKLDEQLLRQINQSEEII